MMEQIKKSQQPTNPNVSFIIAERPTQQHKMVIRLDKKGKQIMNSSNDIGKIDKANESLELSDNKQRIKS